MSTSIGIDVSKARLDAHLLPLGEARQFPNDPAGHRALVRWAGKARPERIVLEATGGYELAALDALHAAGLPVSRVNPLQARHFSRALGTRAKTDAVDALALARMAAAMPLPDYRPAEDWQRALRELVQRRGHLVEAIQQETQRQDRMTLPLVRQQLARHLASLRQQREAMDKAIKALIAQRPERAALDSVKGSGPVLQAHLLALLPELGTLSPKQVASLAGLAPHPRDSGTMRGQRRCAGGRGAIRPLLYMAAMTAIRYEPAIRDFHQRLVAAGKHGSVALVACMRKLLVILNARLRDAMAERAAMA